MSRQFVAAVRSLRKRANLAGNSAKLAGVEWNVDAERASSGFAAVFAMTICAGTDWFAARNPVSRLHASLGSIQARPQNAAPTGTDEHLLQLQDSARRDRANTWRSR